MPYTSVSLAGGGPGLGAAWGRETALRMLAEAAFEKTRLEELPHNFTNFYYLSHKPRVWGLRQGVSQ